MKLRTSDDEDEHNKARHDKGRYPAYSSSVYDNITANPVHQQALPHESNSSGILCNMVNGNASASSIISRGNSYDELPIIYSSAGKRLWEELNSWARSFVKQSNGREKDSSSSMSIVLPSSSFQHPQKQTQHNSSSSLSSSSDPYHVATTPSLLMILWTRFKLTIMLMLWMTSSLASLFYSKYALTKSAMKEDAFTAWLLFCSVFFGVVSSQKVLRMTKLHMLSKSQIKAILPLAFTYLVKEILKYGSLGRISVNLFNTIRSLAPIFNAFLEFVLFRHVPPMAVLVTLIPIVVGVTLTSVEEMSGNGVIPWSVSLLGFLGSILSTGINCGQNIYSKLLFGREKIDPSSLQIYLSGASLMMWIPFNIPRWLMDIYQKGGGWGIWITNVRDTAGESLEVAMAASHSVSSDSRLRIASILADTFVHEFGKRSVSLPLFSYLTPSSGSVLWMLLVAGFLNFYSSQLAFSLLSMVSPLSYSVANIGKRIGVPVIAVYVFHEVLSGTNLFGVILSVIGIFLYERAARSYKLSRAYYGDKSGKVSTANNVDAGGHGFEDRLERLGSGPGLAPPVTMTVTGSRKKEDMTYGTDN